MTLGLAWGGCGGEESAGGGPTGPRPVVVESVTLARELFTERAELLGELQPAETVLMKSEIDGVVESVGFTEGDALQAGAILFELRNREQRARLGEARARLGLAPAEYNRTQRLAKRNAAAEAQLEQRQAELEIARAELELAQVEFERTQVTMPFDGLVGLRLVSPGARITPDDPLVRIDAIDPLQLVFSVPTRVLPLVRLGAEFELTVAPYPDRSFPGSITFVAPSVDSATRRILIKGRVPNPDRLLRPGMFAEVVTELEQRDALLVSEEAVVHDQAGPFVWRIDPEGLAERVDVELGARDGARVEIRSGLRAGDRVVTAGTHKVRPGAKLRTVTAGTQPEGAEAQPLPKAASLRGGDA